MTPQQILNMLDDLDDGQEDCERIAQPLPGLTAGDARYLWALVRADIERRK